MTSNRAQEMKERARELGLVQTSQHDQDLSSIKVENFVGFTKVTLGLAGPLRIVGLGVDRKLYAPLGTYSCGDAAGQNMTTKATSYACGMLRKKYADKYAIKDFFIEGQMESDKKPSCGKVSGTQVVEAIA
ncbi:Hydroxymethylglutaryl-CoA reductase [Fusarium falciforme]|uniref:Hydroxymethylglutaryl-CoA reductase n=1 Tax=Fusarium falciforme TaxID=195108 RepID=UPI0023002FA5|nr:Hydroxymethylglutaryl-CoA reductase [Fusarium falciforme]WAO92324.1 Hydroxymethylglutaryl-CoA reductase [Fusarium falciforme]